MSNATKTAKRSDFKKYFQFMWRSLNIQASWNYERQMNMGFLYGIAPTLDELYPDENDPEQLAHKKEAYEREMAFYNCTPQTSAFTLGLAASMEEQYAADRENFNPETINAVKTSLMGPLSGVGDSFFQGTVRLIAFGLGISLAQQGNVLGPILAMILSIVPAVLVTWFAGKLGYTMGSKYLTKLNGGHSIAVWQENEGVSNEMLLEGRVDFAVKADYSKGSEMEKTVFAVIDQIAASAKTAQMHVDACDRAKRTQEEA